MQFTKMHGCGNDFIVTSLRDNEPDAALTDALPLLCDRHRGIGADGVIILLPSRSADFRMRIFNADGSEAQMCGNGIRCLARYVHERGLHTPPACRFETAAGLITTVIRGSTVEVDMGIAVLEGSRIGPGDHDGALIRAPLTVDGRTFLITAVSMGNPHAVIAATTLDDELVVTWGERIKAHPFFPNGVNVEFVQTLDREHIRVRVNERGVGETAACGTGACAAVVAGILENRLAPRVRVHLNGGDLDICWEGHPDGRVIMSGPAVTVFEGSVDPARLS